MGGVHRGHAFSENAGSVRRAYLCLPYNRIFHAQKLLVFLEKAAQDDMLRNLIEVDETYVLEAQKASM